MRIAATEQMMLPLRVLELSAAINEQVTLQETSGRHTRSLDHLAVNLIRSCLDAVGCENLPLSCLSTLAVMADEALVACMAHLSDPVAHKTYRYLRSNTCKPKCRHGRMFSLLPTTRQRLQLLNCFHRVGGGDPQHYVERFGKHFPDRRIAYSKEQGSFGVLSPRT